MGILDNNIRAAVTAAGNTAAGTAATATERKPSQFWLNVGVNIPNADGTTTFISLPVGIALDDMKPQQIKGSNQDWINMAQTKNALLEQLQKAAGNLEPGTRVPVEALSVELCRVAAPPQQGNVGSNPLMAGLFATLAAPAS